MTDFASQGEWARRVPTSTWKSAILGYGSIAVFLGFFGYWAATAPLAGAAIAPGVVAASGQNLKIEHLEGGTIVSVDVKEGDRVKADQQLLTLDPTVPKAQLDRLLKSDVSLRADAARLTVERDGGESLEFTPDLQKLASDSGLADVLAEQKNEFAARLQRHKNELAILGERLGALEESVSGLEARRTAADEQLKIVKEETSRKLKLLDKGLTDRNQYTQLLRSQADLLGQVATAESQLAGVKNQINEAKGQIVRANSQRVEDSLKELSDVRSKTADIAEQIKAARSVLKRTIVKAPADGIIVSLNVKSPGLTIRPGDTVLELLPTTSNLVIDARVDPRDIDVVQIGQQVRLRFVALNSTTTPEVSGDISYISADRIVDPSTRQPYYTARVRITQNLPPEIKLEQIYPGMPVETYISRGDRTFVEYLIKPIMDSLSRSFREE